MRMGGRGLRWVYWYIPVTLTISALARERQEDQGQG